MLSSRFKNLTPEQTMRRRLRLEKAYKYNVEKVMEDRSGRDKIGIGSGDASMDGTIFVRVTKKIGALFFVKNPEEA